MIGEGYKLHTHFIHFIFNTDLLYFHYPVLLYMANYHKKGTISVGTKAYVPSFIAFIPSILGIWLFFEG